MRRVVPHAPLVQRAERLLAEAEDTAHAMRCRTGVFRTWPHHVGSADETTMEEQHAVGGWLRWRVKHDPGAHGAPHAPAWLLAELAAVRAQVMRLRRQGAHPWLDKTLSAIDRARRRLQRLLDAPDFYMSDLRDHARLALPYSRAVREQARQQRASERYASTFDAAEEGVAATRSMLRVVLARVREVGRERAAEYGYPPEEVAEWAALVPQLREEARLLERMRARSRPEDNPARVPVQVEVAPDRFEWEPVDTFWSWELVYAYLRRQAEEEEQAALGDQREPEPPIAELRGRVLELLRLALDQRDDEGGVG
jgi:hypothetical protein